MSAEANEKHPRCPECGYNLTGLVDETTRCPECGHVSLVNELAWGEPPLPGTVSGCLLFILVSAPTAWLFPAWLAGVTEAWDGEYAWMWMVATAVCSGVTGWLAPRFWLLWPFLLAFAQFLAMLISEPGGGGLWPIGLCFMLGFGLLCLAPAALGAKLRSMWGGAG